MFDQLLTGYETRFLVVILLSLAAGVAIGIERESRAKAAGISTQSLVIAGAAMFTMMSALMNPNNPGSIAAYIVTGIGFLGAGMILKGDGGQIKNLTTAASVWFSAAIGMAIGFGWYFIAVAAVILAIFVPRIPHFERKHPKDEHLPH